MENLCNECKRICHARNTDRTITVLSCDAYIMNVEKVNRTEIQTRLL